MKKKLITGILLILVLLMVLFLALQGPKETTDLSNSVRQWFMKLGYKGTSVQFRSDVHPIEYFIVGFAVILFCKTMGWKPWIGLIAACLFGLLEETVKIFLPTREFGPADVLKDFIGAGIAFGVIMICVMLKNRASKAFTLRQG